MAKERVVVIGSNDCRWQVSPAGIRKLAGCGGIKYFNIADKNKVVKNRVVSVEIPPWHSEDRHRRILSKNYGIFSISSMIFTIFFCVILIKKQYVISCAAKHDI